MPCLICGDPKTVRSHLVPKAIAKEIRGDQTNHVVLELDAERPQSLQAGRFDDDLLCSTHEGLTGEFDRYGVNFMRRVESGRKLNPGTGFFIDNPEPEKLSRFALSIVWRAVASSKGNAGRNALGSRYDAVTNAVFTGAAPRSPLFVGTAGLTHEGREMKIATMPECFRDDGLWLWCFQLLSSVFILHVGNGQFPGKDIARADREARPYIANMGDQNALAWPRMGQIIRSIKRHPQAER